MFALWFHFSILERRFFFLSGRRLLSIVVTVSNGFFVRRFDFDTISVANHIKINRATIYLTELARNQLIYEKSIKDYR